MNTPLSASAELFVATGCRHCPIVLKELTEQLKQGALASLKITNIAVDNARAEELNIRSVPWFSLSNKTTFMIFPGQYSQKEIQQWLATSKTKDGMQEYITEFLSSGQLMTIVQAININPEIFSHVINMIKDEETSMDTRIGLDVLIENFSSSKILQQYTNVLKEIVLLDDTRLKIDALHYIALTGNIKNKGFLEESTKSSDSQVKEAAIEALETLDNLIN